MRQFDNRNSYFDNENKPLIGRVKFCKLDTTELEDIYNSDGNALANPVFTNTLGQLQYQVFLKDHTDYTIVFEKYIGNGTFTEDNDISNWLFQYSCDNIYDIYGITVDCDGVQAVNTIQDLIDFDPRTLANDRNYIQVLGYDELGDCEPVYYRWHSTSSENTNGGSIIQSSVLNYGRWKLVNTFLEYFDVRHFGVFGAMTRNSANISMGVKIVAAQNYATSIGKKLYFPAIDNDVTWYNFYNVSSISNSLFDKDTWVFATDGNSHRIEVDENSGLNIYGDGNFTLAGKTVYTSWGASAEHVIFDPSSTLYFDSTCITNHRDSTNIIIEADAGIAIDNWFFDGCKLNLIKNIGDYCYFQNCRVEEKLFADSCDFQTITVHYSDILDIEDFPTTWKWVVLRSQLADNVVDFKGRTVDSTYVFGWTIEATYKNAVFNNYNAIHNNVTLENCFGTLTIPYAKNIYITKGSNVVIANTDTALNAVGITDSTVRLDYGTDILVTNLVIKNSTLDDEYNKVINTYNFTAEHSKVFPFIVMMTVGSTNCTAEYSDITTINTGKIKPIIQNCVIYRGIISRENDSGNIDFDLINNVFLNYDSQSFGHHLAADTHANSHVIGRWINNSSMLPSHFIIIDRTNIDLDEQSHSYVYESNTGPNVLQRCEAKWSDIQIWGGTQGSPKVITGAQRWENGPFAVRFNGTMFRNDENGGGHTNPDVYLTQFTMFTVGTRNIGQLALTCIPPQHLEGDFYNSPRDLWVTSNQTSVDEKERLWYSSNVGTPAGIMFISGYTWRITHVYHMYELNNYANMPAYFELPVNYHISKY